MANILDLTADVCERVDPQYNKPDPWPLTAYERYGKRIGMHNGEYVFNIRAEAGEFNKLILCNSQHEFVTKFGFNSLTKDHKYCDDMVIGVLKSLPYRSVYVVRRTEEDYAKLAQQMYTLTEIDMQWFGGAYDCNMS